MCPRHFASAALMLLACTGSASAQSDNKEIPYDTEEECLLVTGTEWFNDTSTCACSLFYLPAPNRTTCLTRLSNAAQPCELSEQCADVMKFGECRSGLCSCPDGFHYLRGRCWPTSRLGETCRRSEQCHVNNDPLSATCNITSQLCECSRGYYARGGIDCRPEAGVGDQCGIDNDCRFPGGVCDSSTGRCNSSTTSTTTSATQGTTAATSTGVPVLVGGPCENDTSCAGLDDSRCFGRPGRCECLPGFYGDDGASACVREIGEPCNTTEDCSGISGSECRRGVCTCAINNITTSNNRACKPAKTYGNSCSPKYPELCSNYGEWCRCLDKPNGDSGQQCLCLSGYHFIEEENLCWVNRGLNESCSSDLDCVVDVGSAVCSGDHVCLCAPGLYVSSDGSQCVNVTALGSKCSTNNDCSVLGDNIECTASKCRCANHFYPGTNNSSPLCLPGLEAPCQSNSSCSKENSACINSLCACDEGYVASGNNDECLEVANTLNANCTEVKQCTQNLGDLSLCKNNQCVCADGNQYRSGKCREKKVPGDPCGTSDECFVANNVSLVECRNSVCQCKFGYAVSNDQKCVSRGPVSTAAVLLWATAAIIATCLPRLLFCSP